MQPRVPTRQPVFLLLLQPGGRTVGLRACALAFKVDRVPILAIRLGALIPTFAPTPARHARRRPYAAHRRHLHTAMDSPAAAITTSRFLHMQRLLV
jgi:hypothetical protein